MEWRKEISELRVVEFEIILIFYHGESRTYFLSDFFLVNRIPILYMQRKI